QRARHHGPATCINSRGRPRACMVRAPLHLRKTQSNLLLADRESAMHMLIPFGLRIGAASHLRHKKPACERIPRESWTMADDRCEEIPLVPRDDLYEEASLAP